MTRASTTRAAEVAADVVAKATIVAADTAEKVAEAAATRIAAAVKSAAETVSTAAQVQAQAALTTAAVVTSRLDAMEKRYDHHESADSQRFESINQGQKEIKAELKDDINEVASDVKDLRTDQKNQTKIITLFTGGAITLSVILQLAVPLLFRH